MEIQLYNQNGLAGIPKREIEIVQALESRMINIVPERELFELFKTGITAGYAIARWDAPKDPEYTIMIDQVMKICKSSYGTLRELEITIAITRGVIGEYGEFMGLSIKSFVGFVKGYLSEESRVKLLAEKNKPMEVKKEPTPEEQWNAFVARLKQVYDLYLSKANIQPSEATFIFKVLRRSGVINFDQVRRDALKNKAQDALKLESDPKRARTPQERRKLTAEVERITSKGTNDDAVINRAMAIGLIEWFNDIKEIGITIDEVVNEEF